MDRQIILMRHGRPDLVPVGKISALDMKCWIEQYERSEIVNQPVPEARRELAATAKVIVSSSAPRALASVGALGLEPTLVDEIYCEAQLPHARWKRLRLSPFTWAFIFRFVWLCGFSGGGESAREARVRARTAAQRLHSLAGEGPVLLLGHGFMNRMIAKQLESAGWICQKSSSNRYWSTTVFHHIR